MKNIFRDEFLVDGDGKISVIEINQPLNGDIGDVDDNAENVAEIQNSKNSVRMRRNHYVVK